MDAPANTPKLKKMNLAGIAGRISLIVLFVLYWAPLLAHSYAGIINKIPLELPRIHLSAKQGHGNTHNLYYTFPQWRVYNSNNQQFFHTLQDDIRRQAVHTLGPFHDNALESEDVGEVALRVDGDWSPAHIHRSLDTFPPRNKQPAKAHKSRRRDYNHFASVRIDICTLNRLNLYTGSSQHVHQPKTRQHSRRPHLSPSCLGNGRR